MTDIESEEEALYVESPDSFVAARDALAKQLRVDGDRAGAARVRALRRPTRAAWAINLAVRQHPDAAQELTDAAGCLGDAQRELLTGGDPSHLREAQARVDAACDTLTAAVPVTDPPTLEKIRQTLRAATVDADALADVTSGRLLRERVASGFGDLGGFVPAPREATPHVSAPGKVATSARAVAAATRTGREAAEQTAVEAAERAARDAEERAAQEAEERAAAARRARISQAREQEEAAAAAAADAQRALHDAEAAMAERLAASDAAEARLADAVQAREQAERN
ncbi:hypothetical protein VSS74_02010 [Conexibacter stalactiti]|uniref:Transposase n=1 Tax=Conexibacter stalactiti TaxID=1940611 RepID=A0ABU4HIF4_9ACTN|nr:hypothetical protein [Conexibacter stalactiti]MDW5593094.1 hypothetical protein [Conexibacter stalactiti]MEC5033735.1 hypothetical protein [Conexibacter stalactiti]